MARLRNLLVAALVLIALAFALNPSGEQHRAKIRAAVADRSPLAGALGVGALTAFASEYHSIGIASWTTAGDRTLSVGAFGIVIVR